MEVRKRQNLIIIAVLAAIALICAPNSSTAATIDGIVTSGEYSNGIIYDVDLGYMSDGNWVDVDADGKLYLDWNTINQLAVAYEVPIGINDNYFGTSSQLHPTAPWPGSGRDYGALEASDMARFEFQDDIGGVLLTFQMDYFRDPNLPDQTVGQGKDKYQIDTTKNSFVMFGGSTTIYNPGTAEFDNTIFDMATSLMWNYSTGGYTFDDADQNSPTPDDPNYVGKIIYEFLIDTTDFNGFGLLLADSHHSPSKLEIESFSPPPDTPYDPPPIPEPGTIFLLGTGLIGAGLTCRKRFRKLRTTL